MPRTLLKVTGYASVERLNEAVASYLVDIGYAVSVFDGYALLSPDDPADVCLDDDEDYEWFSRVVVESMTACGEANVTVERYEH